jgi:hypothetical protein
MLARWLRLRFSIVLEVHERHYFLAEAVRDLAPNKERKHVDGIEAGIFLETLPNTQSRRARPPLPW